MPTTTVTTQAELDAALAASAADPDNIHTIDIRSAASVELIVADNNGARINVRGESRVQRVGRVGGSARVDWVGGNGHVGEVVGNGSVGTVVGNGSVGTVVGNGHVGEVDDNGSVDWVGGNGRVGRVGGNGRVGTVGGNGHVGEVDDNGSVGTVVGNGHVGEVDDNGSVDWVDDNARVGRVGGNGHVDWVDGNGRVDWVDDNGSVGRVDDNGSVGRVGGNGRVGRVGGNGSVGRATETATIHLHDQAVLGRAGAHVAVFLHSQRATVTGGHLIDLTALDETDPAQWADHHGVDVVDGHLVVYKAVRDDWRSSRGTIYQPGTTASCVDFTDVDECGGGLHFSPTPRQAHTYDGQATRFVELRVPIDAVRTITGGGVAKAKAPAVECIREVDIDARPMSEPDAR